MSAATRQRDALRRRNAEPYITLRCDDLLSAACDLDPATLRIWLLLQANWKPPRRGSAAGEAFISYSQAVKLAGHGRSVIAAAFRRLEGLGLIILVRAGSRPLAPGAAAGKRQAAVWDLPTRHAHARPAPPLPAGVDRPWGKVRLNVHRVRADVRELSPAATKVLAFAVARQHRDKHGGLAEPTPFPLPARQLARVLRLSASGVAEAVGELAAKRRLLLAKPKSGRRAATFKLRGHYATHEKHGGRVPAPPEPMVTTGGPGSGRESPATVTASVPVVEAKL